MSYMTGKDMLLLPDGATYHLGAKAGELASRIIVVGSKARGEAMATLLERIEHRIESNRQMFTHTGVYKKTRVSIVAIGMGSPMMDFFVREASYICPEPMAIIRIGTCGLFNPSLVPGTIVASGKGSTYTYINYATFTNGLIDGQSVQPTSQYLTTKPVLPDQELNDLMVAEMKKLNLPVVDGMNNASETFYAAQGRQDAHFYNGENACVLENYAKAGIDSCEMEAFTLLQLAKQRTIAPLRAAACHIGILNRINSAMTENISTHDLHESELNSARACLEALIAIKL